MALIEEVVKELPEDLGGVGIGDLILDKANRICVVEEMTFLTSRRVYRIVSRTLTNMKNLKSKRPIRVVRTIHKNNPGSVPRRIPKLGWSHLDGLIQTHQAQVKDVTEILTNHLGRRKE